MLVLFTKWNVATMLGSVSTVFSDSWHQKLPGRRKKPHLNWLFLKWRSTTLIGFLSSTFSHLQIISLLSDLQRHLDLEYHTAYAFSPSWRSFCTLTRPSPTQCMIHGCHFLFRLFLKWTVHSSSIPTQRRHPTVQELEQAQSSEIWLQNLLWVVFGTNLSVQPMIQGT